MDSKVEDKNAIIQGFCHDHIIPKGDLRKKIKDTTKTHSYGTRKLTNMIQISSSASRKNHATK